MTNIFTGTPKHQGIGGDCALVTDFDGRVMICASDRGANDVVIIAMTPEQARDLAQGIVAAAEQAEAHQ